MRGLVAGQAMVFESRFIGGSASVHGTQGELMTGMKAIIQLDRTGCGIAAVAALAGVNYREARLAASRLDIYVDDPALWSETEPVRRLLTAYGIKSARTEVRFSAWEALPDCALLAVKWHKERGRAFWHWVVFWRGPQGPVVLDSKRMLRRHVRTDFGRMKPKWFIPVHRK